VPLATLGGLIALHITDSTLNVASVGFMRCSVSLSNAIMWYRT
jgi:Cu/Ag efflux pump CusA